MFKIFLDCFRTVRAEFRDCFRIVGLNFRDCLQIVRTRFSGLFSGSPGLC